MGRDLASAIVAARRTAGLTQAALARRAGISASYLSRIEGSAWERGGPLPADGVLRALARALGVSSTALVALRPVPPGPVSPAAPGRGNGRQPYAVSVGAGAVDAAARGLVARNPPTGTLRSAQVFVASEVEDGDGETSYLDDLGEAMATSPDGLLYRLCVTDRQSLATVRDTVDRVAGGRPPAQAANVRTRVTPANPLALDVLAGDHEVFLGFPDRRGHPRLRAGIVVDDPDFVAAVRAWFDETVWDPPGGYADLRVGDLDLDDVDDLDGPLGAAGARASGAEQHLDPATTLFVVPRADADELERPGQDVPAVAG